MIKDANSVEAGAILRADLCIVGAGAAGIAIALQFLRSGLGVLVLESGGEREEPDTQDLYAGELVDAALHSPPHHYRRRAFGGSTGVWGGRCMPFDPIDFEARPWVPHSGWPIGIEALLPYYPAANLLCEAGEFAYTAAEAFPRGMRAMLPGFSGGSFSADTLERFSCPTDFGRRYRARLAASADVTVLLHANVVELECNEAGDRISGMRVRTLAGRDFRVSAGTVVLAAGGLEVARLLLASRSRHPAGIGNAHDLVGRFYMCHIAGTAGEIRSPDVWHGYDIAEDGTYCRRRLALRPAAQKRLGVGNFIARLHHPRIPDPAHRTGALSALFLAKPFIRYEYRKRLHGEGPVAAAVWLAHARNVVSDPLNTAGFLLHWLRRRTLAVRKVPTVVIRPRAGRYSIDFHAEQAPNPDSRVVLSGARDALGMPRLRVDWRYSATDIRTVEAGFAALTEDLRASGCGELAYDALAHASLRDGAYGGHHIGTARMAARPADGVVDHNCRVFGVANLFIAGSAVFPTSSQANPTLTLVALALRLAAHIADRKQAVLF